MRSGARLLIDRGNSRAYTNGQVSPLVAGEAMENRGRIGESLDQTEALEPMISAETKMEPGSRLATGRPGWRHATNLNHITHSLRCEDVEPLVLRTQWSTGRPCFGPGSQATGNCGSNRTNRFDMAGGQQPQGSGGSSKGPLSFRNRPCRCYATHNAGSKTSSRCGSRRSATTVASLGR